MRRKIKSADPECTVETISRQFAGVNLYMQLGQRVKKVETIILMSQTTFINNIWGLFGM